MASEIWTYHDGDAVLRGEVYRPAGYPNGRAVLVVHEADGIGGNVRRHCAMLAEQGYLAAAADLHGEGRVLEGDDVSEAIARFRGDPTLFRHRVRAGFDAMLAIPGVIPTRSAAMGYCFGGTAVLELARSGAPVAAVASFHGLLTTAVPAQAGTVASRVLACTGARDPLVPPGDIAAFQQEMAEADVDWQLLVFGRALHSFTNDSVDGRGDPRMAYDRIADAQSWAVLLRFLEDSFAIAP
jgi:dienelactone hydrolase